jgi:hypothetical protein
MQQRRRFRQSSGKRHSGQGVEASCSAGQLSPKIIHVANPTSFGGRGSIIMLELADDDSAKKVAQRIATETGRRVTIRDADMTVIQTIPAAKIH